MEDDVSLLFLSQMHFVKQTNKSVYCWSNLPTMHQIIKVLSILNEPWCTSMDSTVRLVWCEGSLHSNAGQTKKLWPT